MKLAKIEAACRPPLSKSLLTISSIIYLVKQQENVAQTMTQTPQTAHIELQGDIDKQAPQSKEDIHTTAEAPAYV